MYQDELQKQAHDGNQEAFRELYGLYSKKVYSLVHTALGDAESSRDAVKQIFLQLYRMIMRGDSDLDIPAELSNLTNKEIRMRRIAAGDLSDSALQVQYVVSADDDIETNDTMVKIRSRMLGNEDKPEAEVKPVKTKPEVKREVVEEKVVEPVRVKPEVKRETVSERVAEPQPKAEVKREAPAPVYQEDLTTEYKKHGGSIFAGILLFLLVLVFLWLMAGILMDLGYIPFVDLGYSFFNQNVFELFQLQQ